MTGPAASALDERRATTPPPLVDDEADAGSLRERKKQRTWQALHRAARELVIERGLDGVTVDEICALAEVSSRTFFNYFPTKAAAALGLHEPVLGDAALAEFHRNTGRAHLIDDLCALVASTVHLPPDRALTKELIERRPEITPAMHRWVSDVRIAARDAVRDRADPETARIAVTLVVAALLDAVHDDAPASQVDLADRLRRRIRTIRELIDD